MRAPIYLANLTAYVRPASEQSEKSTGTRMLRTSRCCARAREVDEVSVARFLSADFTDADASLGQLH
jgi:hypothetical protein